MRSFVLLLLWIAVPLMPVWHAQGSYFFAAASAGGGGGTTGDLFDQKFNVTETPSGWTTSGTSTINFDDTSSPLEGAQMLTITHSASQGRALTATFTAQGTMYGYLLWKRTSNTGSCNILEVIAPSIRMKVECSGTGGLFVTHGSVSSTATTTTVSTGTAVHVWWRYTKATVAANDGYGEVSWSTDGIRPTSGNQFSATPAAPSGGTSTTDVNQVAFGDGDGSNETAVFHYDSVKGNTTQIGDNP